MEAIRQKISNKQHRALAALLETPTIKDAAKTARIGETTIFRWLQNQDFQRSYRAAKRQLVDQAITRLQTISGEAVEALRKVMNNSQSPPSSQVSAAKAVLELAIRAVEFQDLEMRIDQLEKKLNQKGTS